MGWGYCGTDSKNREIGYCIDATCDYVGCNNKINRGLSYACGGMHGEPDGACEGYFCENHLHYVCDKEGELPSPQLCPDCKAEWDVNACNDCNK